MLALSYSIDGDEFRYVLMQKKGKEISLLEQGSSKEKSEIGSVLFDLLDKCSTDGQIVSFISAKFSYHSSFSFPFNSESKLKQALPFQLSTIAQNEEGSVHCVYPTFKNKTTRSVGVFSASKKAIAKALASSSYWSLNLDRLTSEGMAHARFLEWKNITSAFVVSLQKDSAVVTLIKDGLFCESIILPPSQIQRATDLLSSKYTVESLPTIKEPFVSEIGAAIDALKADKRSIQFCKEEFTPKKQIQKLKKLYARALGLAIASFCLILSAINSFESKEVYSLVQALDARLKSANIMKTGYSFHGSHFSQLQSDLVHLETLLAKVPKFYDHTSHPPQIASLLSTLSFLNLSIEGIDYELIEYPTPEDMSSRYVAKVVIKVLNLADAQAIKETLKKAKKIEVKTIEDYFEVHFLLS
jgi:hypothetical protein